MILLWLSAVHSAEAQTQPPRFQSGVEVTAVDVTVVDGEGRPVLDLRPGDFLVQVDGVRRRVVSAEWVPLTPTAAHRAAAPALPQAFSSNVNRPPGRILLIAIDQQNIRFGGLVSVRDAIVGFIDRLEPADRVAVMSIGPGTQAVPFTADREQVKRALSRMAGQKMIIRAGGHQIAIWEALAIHRDDAEVLRMVVYRECGVEPSADPGGCEREVKSQADFMALNTIAEGERTLNALRALFDGLRRIDAPKTLMLVTDGFLLDDQRASFVELERLAAESRTTLYALRLDQRVADISQRGALSPGSAGRDRIELRQGLDLLANATRGRVFDVVMTADSALARIESEISGYYLLGVESEASDRDDRDRMIFVDVDRRGALVRSRRRLFSADDGRPRAARDRLAAALASPLTASALPMQVGTFSLRGPDPSKVQLLIHADIGADYTSGSAMTVAYLVLDADGRIVDTGGRELQLQPLAAGLPSPLQYNVSAALDPGEYVLRIAATDGERVGSVEHRVHASLTTAERVNEGQTPNTPVALSDLIAGGPVYAAAGLQPTITSTVRFGNLHAYMEAYGAGIGAAPAKYEVAQTDDGPALLNADVSARMAGDERAIFTRVLSVRRLPPGAYVLRAILTAPESCGATLSGSPTCPAKTITRGFVIPDSPESPGGDVFLPVGDERLAGRFGPADMSDLDDEAVAVWRRADVSMKGRRYGEARALLEQAIAKWPVDARFAMPLALLYATFGQGTDAVRMLQRHLTAQPDDVESLGMAVEWIYTLHARREVAWTRAEDVQLARAYAAAYRKANGPEAPLVQVWLDFIEARGR